MFGGSQPGWSGSVRQILTDESNPHLRGIFHPGANPTLPSSNQTATGMGSLRPGWPGSQPNTRSQSPTKKKVLILVLEACLPGQSPTKGPRSEKRWPAVRAARLHASHSHRTRATCPQAAAICPCSSGQDLTDQSAGGYAILRPCLSQ